MKTVTVSLDDDVADLLRFNAFGRYGRRKGSIKRYLTALISGSKEDSFFVSLKRGVKAGVIFNRDELYDRV